MVIQAPNFGSPGTSASGRINHEFRVYLPEAQRVELVGCFTSWRSHAVEMTRESSGWWSATTDLAPGDYEFSYLVNHSTWLPDYAASGVKRNGFGGWVSQLHVAPAVTVNLRSRQAA